MDCPEKLLAAICRGLEKHSDMSHIYDHAGSLRRMGDDVQLFQEMVELLRCDAPKHLAAARRSLADQDWPSLERAAHTLKGLAANFGAARAVGGAAELEQLTKRRVFSQVEGALAALEEALDELVAALPHDAAASHAR